MKISFERVGKESSRMTVTHKKLRSPRRKTKIMNDFRMIRRFVWFPNILYNGELIWLKRAYFVQKEIDGRWVTMYLRPIKESCE